MINDLLTLANKYLFGPGLAVAVFLCGIILIVRLKPFMLLKVRKVASSLAEKPEQGGLSPVKAMLVALAGTLGVGNIAGVASAIALGGAGSIFWMWVSAIAAMPIKYAEIVLAVGHRRRDNRRTDNENRFHGGAHFYIEDLGTNYPASSGFAKKAAHFFAGAFAFLCLATSITMGGAVQSNAIAVSADKLFSLNPVVCGIIVAVPVFLVISGGLKRIADFTTKLVPLMSGIYILMSLYIIVSNSELLIGVLSRIVSSAFSAEAVGGGIVGFLTNRTLAIGVTRGIVSNEAGCGTAPIAHASANVKAPPVQGLWGIVEVFVDTIVICSMTAFAVLIAEEKGIAVLTDGMESALNAYGYFIPYSDAILAFAVFVFAFCTIVCWFYYGIESLSYLTRSESTRKVYTIVYTLCVAVGCILSDNLVWSLADFSVSLMTAVNIIAVMLYIPEIKRVSDGYFFGKSKKSDEKILARSALKQKSMEPNR